MKHLWAPWRMGYITKTKRNKDICVFCKILQEKKDAKNYIVIRKRHSFAVLNIFPYNNGHLLVLPYRHVSDLSQLRPEEKQELFDLLEEIKALLDKVLKPGGYNIGMNLGKMSGAGFPGHLHIHIVPRWQGDVNFMPVIGQTKVISQSLKELYRLLIHAHKTR
ncbi:MAG TPA: HIT domain-containing protein [Candidatus Omnitrophota bacterium]|nr:HIT domain-containing protein [Candidatus Omnitrophota bacterium]